MRKRFFVILFPVFITYFFLLLHPASGDEKTLKMSTTTSTLASGLLDVLLPELEKDTGIKVKVIAKGTGAAIRDGMDGNVDMIFVHAKDREEAFINEGYGTKRYAVMHNDFVILGPSEDPAMIKGSNDVVASLKKIASAKALFVSRGDDSGTHIKEQSLWEMTGFPLEIKKTAIVKKNREREVRSFFPENSGRWYLSIGQGMGKTLTLGDEKQAYLISDRGTYIKYKFGRDIPIDLDVLCEGDPLLENPYAVIPVNPGKHPHVRFKHAMVAVKWLISKKGQSLIDSYKLFGNQLFYSDVYPENKPIKTRFK